MKCALCVGIDDYPSDGKDMRGSVRDANEWMKLLVDHYGFEGSDVKLLLNEKATKANIMRSLERMIATAAPGDVVVFTVSSHGTYVYDENWDEDGYDEAICPYDSVDDPDMLIIDDELAEVIDRLRDGVGMTVILDTCHSGKGLLNPPDDDADTGFLSPGYLGLPVIEDMYGFKPRRLRKRSEADMKATLLSACRYDQQAWRVELGGEHRGVLSYFAVSSLREGDLDLTLREWHERIVRLMKANKFPQQPQLEGREELKDRRVFS